MTEEQPEKPVDANAAEADAPSHVVIVGPGARAFPLLRGEIEAALGGALVGRVSGVPRLVTLSDESEPIFSGLGLRTLDELDQSEFAGLSISPSAERA